MVLMCPGGACPSLHGGWKDGLMTGVATIIAIEYVPRKSTKKLHLSSG